MGMEQKPKIIAGFDSPIIKKDYKDKESIAKEIEGIEKEIDETDAKRGHRVVDPAEFSLLDTKLELLIKQKENLEKKLSQSEERFFDTDSKTLN
jgi:hypothetical protein